MSYFNTNETFFVIPLNTNDEEIKKINYLLALLAYIWVKSCIKLQDFLLLWGF